MINQIEQLFEDIIINPIGNILFDKFNLDRLIEKPRKVTHNKRKVKIPQIQRKGKIPKLLRKSKPKFKRLRRTPKGFFFQIKNF